MTIAVILILGTLLVAWTAPRLLEHRLHGGADPQTLLVGWIALVGGSLLSLMTAVSLVLVPEHSPARHFMNLVHHSWAAVTHGSAPRIGEIAELLSVVLVALAVLRCSSGVIRHTRQRRTLHRKHLDLVRILTGTGATPGSTLWLDVPDPMAYSVAGRPALVVASHGLRRHLPAEAVAAVLEHERAHLRGWHHLIVAIAEALAAALPWLPLMRRSPHLVRALVELSADAVAARSHSPRTVRAALLSLSASPVPTPGLGMATDCIALRLAALSSDRSEHSDLKRALHSALAGAIAVLLPAFASATILAAANIAFHHFLG